MATNQNPPIVHTQNGKTTQPHKGSVTKEPTVIIHTSEGKKTVIPRPK